MQPPSFPWSVKWGAECVPHLLSQSRAYIRLLGENCLLRLGATGPLGIINKEELLPGRFRAHETPRSEPCSPLPASLPTQPMEVFVDDETKLTLHGLQQYYVKLKDSEKNRKLFDLLDVLEFNQVMLPLAHTKI